VRLPWWLVLGCGLMGVGCRLVAGYEDLELTPTDGTGGAGGGVAGSGGEAGAGGSGGSGPQVTITTLTAQPSHVVGAREVEIAWVVDNADSCEFDEGLGQAAPYWGDVQVEPTTTTTYTLTCQGPGGPASDDVIVTVLGVTLTGGGGFTCARVHNNHLKCFGSNTAGQLGVGDTDPRGDEAGEMGDVLQPIDVGSGHNVLFADPGDEHICVILDDNNVKCWGENSRGQLGLGITEDQGDDTGEMGDQLDWVTVGGADGIAAGGRHSCAKLLNGNVKCWGANDQGQLGLGHDSDLGGGSTDMQNVLEVLLGTGRTATAVVAGTAHSCALLDNSTVKCWGANQLGQLGQEHQNALGDGSGEMGDALLPVDLGTGRTATAIGAAGDHTCALLDNSHVKCWGDNSRGQLGTGDAVNHGEAANTMGDALLQVDLGTGRTVQAIAIGGAHGCALTDNDRVKCWGANGHGQLGLGDQLDRGNAMVELGDNLGFVELGAQYTVLSIGAGSHHSCAVIDDGTVRCWGRNSSGELGLGDTFDRGVNQGQMGDSLSLVDITP